MYGRKAAVARRHRLKERVGLLSPHLAHDYVVRPLPQRGPQELEHIYLALPLGPPGGPGEEGGPVLVVEPYLPGVLYRHHLIIRVYEVRECAQRGRLPAGRRAGYDQVLLVLYQLPEVGRQVLVERAPKYQLRYREGLLGELPYREAAPPGGYLSPEDRVDPATVGERGIQYRIGEGDGPAGEESQPQHDGVQLLLGLEDNVGPYRLEVLVPHVDRGPHADATYVLYVGVPHHHVYLPEARGVPLQVVQDFIQAVLRHLEPELPDGPLRVRLYVALRLLPVGEPIARHLHHVREQLLQLPQNIRFLGRQLGLDHVVDVFVPLLGVRHDGLRVRVVALQFVYLDYLEGRQPPALGDPRGRTPIPGPRPSAEPGEEPQATGGFDHARDFKCDSILRFRGEPGGTIPCGELRTLILAAGDTEGT